MFPLLLTESFKAASPDLLADVTNGCGPGAWKFNLIPSKLREVFKPACDQHDFDYYEGIDQRGADNRLLVNGFICAVNHCVSGGILRVIELRALIDAIWAMYLAVRAGGHAYFGTH